MPCPCRSPTTWSMAPKLRRGQASLARTGFFKCSPGLFVWVRVLFLSAHNLLLWANWWSIQTWSCNLKLPIHNTLDYIGLFGSRDCSISFDWVVSTWPGLIFGLLVAAMTPHVDLALRKMLAMGVPKDSWLQYLYLWALFVWRYWEWRGK